MARIALADSVIKAPLSAVISKRLVQAGEKLAPDMPVGAIVNLGQLNTRIDHVCINVFQV